MPKKIIGIFDSGIGGTSIRKEIVSLLPKTKTIYLADTKNFPYGDKKSSELREIAFENTKQLIGKGANLIVVACNTATLHSIEYLRKSFPKVQFVGVEPAVKPASKISKKGVIILSSPKTTKSHGLRSLIKKYGNKTRILNLASLELVDAIENHDTELNIKNILSEILPKSVLKNSDVLVLGCTHFPLKKKLIQEYVGKDIKVIDSGRGVANRVATLLNYN